MEQSTKKFMDRFNEIDGAFRKLEERQRDIPGEIEAILKENAQSLDVDVTKLLGGESKQIAEITHLKEEQKSVQDYLGAIARQGGLSTICKTDVVLEEAGEALVKDLIKQAKEDSKNRDSLQKRYDKVIKEILQLTEERREFIQDGIEKENMFRFVLENTKVDVKLADFTKHYSFEMPNVLFHLERTKNAVAGKK